MTPVMLKEEIAAHDEVVPLTVAQYHRMLRAGILEEGEPIELLDGLLVPKDRGEGMTVNPLHRLIVSRLMSLAPRFETGGCHLQLQSPVTIEPNQEPEPDGLIVRGSPERYAECHPGPDDVSCLVEVADSSLARDRSIKQRIYATAGVEQYLIVNLADRQIEVYEDPRPEDGRYGSVRILQPGDEVAIRLPKGRQVEVGADYLLP